MTDNVNTDANNVATSSPMTPPWESSAQFQACAPFIYKEEGGYSNTPGDNGGPTNKGITQKEYSPWLRKKGLSPASVRNITKVQADEIYWFNYWLPHCPDLPPGIDLSFFNMAVNGGPWRAIKLLQQTLNIADDGIWGPNTEAAVKLIAPRSDVNGYALAATKFYKGLASSVEHDRKFLSDWLGRTERCRVLALSMVKS